MKGRNRFMFVKIIYGTNEERLEKDINIFIADKEVIDIKFNFYTGFGFSACVLILYKYKN